MMFGLQAKLVTAAVALLISLGSAGFIWWQSNTIKKLRLEQHMLQESTDKLLKELDQARVNDAVVAAALAEERKRAENYRRMAERIGHGETALPAPQRDVLEFLQQRAGGDSQH